MGEMRNGGKLTRIKEGGGQLPGGVGFKGSRFHPARDRQEHSPLVATIRLIAQMV